MSSPRMKRKTLYLIGAWIGAPLLAMLVIFNRAPEPLALGVALVALLAAMGLSTAWFRSLDEVAQRAHYEAWFWGGNCGLLLLPLAVVVMAMADNGNSWIGRTLDAVLTRPIDVETAFIAGIFAVIVPMMLGYSLWWAWFWLRNR